MAEELNVNPFKEYLDICPPDATYLSAGSVDQILTCISNKIEFDVLKTARNQTCIAILADETCDEGNLEQFSIFGKFPFNGSTEHYLGIVNVENITAEGLMGTISNLLIAKGIDIEKVIFVAFDGCNTMSGSVKGVQRLFRHQSVYSIYVNCRNHKLALCFKLVMKDYSILQETDACLVSFAKLFEYSAQKDNVLRNIQEVKGEKVLEPIKPSVTRWLSHKDSCVRIFHRYESYIDALDQIYTKTKDPQVFGVRAILLKPEVVAMIVILCDILSVTNKLSLILQSSDVNFTKLPVYVDSTINALQSIVDCLDKDSGKSLEYFSKIDSFFEVISERNQLGRRLRNLTDIDKFDKDVFMSGTIKPLVQDLINEIKEAMHVEPVLQAFGVLDPRNLPDNIEELIGYGEAEITELSKHYGTALQDTYKRHTKTGTPILDGPKLVAEFNSFKHQMYALKQRVSDTDKVEFARDILGHFEKEPVLKGIYGNLYQIYLLSQVIPLSTACVERCFSQLKLIKTSLRTRLSNKTLDHLLRLNHSSFISLPEQTWEDIVDGFKNFGPDRRIDL